MKQRTQHYLILDRCDRDNPRWVLATAVCAKPARVPDDLDREHGLAPGTRWLGEFHGGDFSWLEFLFGRVSALRITHRGEECFATRISHGGPHIDDDTGVYHAGSLGEHLTE